MSDEMIRVEGVTDTTVTTAKPYWYWTYVGTNKVNLTDNTVELPRGDYRIYWDLRGIPGSKLSFNLKIGGRTCCSVVDIIPDGPGQAQGQTLCTIS